MSSSPNPEQETTDSGAKKTKKITSFKELQAMGQNLGKAAYIVLGLIGILLIGIGTAIGIFTDDGSTIKDLFLNLGTSLVSVAIVFLVIERYLEYEPISFLQGALERQVDRLERTIETAAEQLENLDIIEGEEEVYAYLTTKLESGYWPTIRIFAPFSLAGLPEQQADITQPPQQEKPPKLKWFEALQKYARNHEQCSVYAVFGLPNLVSDEKEKPAVLERLGSIRKILEGFKLDNVALYHIPPSLTSMGLGFVLFEDANNEGFLVTGLASQGHSQVVDSGISVKHRRAVRRAATWFDRTLIGNELANFRLHGTKADFDEKWIQIEGSYRGQYFQRLVGSKEVYSAVANLNQDMESYFRAFVVGNAKSPKKWTRNLARNLKKGPTRQNVTIIAINFQEPPSKFQIHIEERLKQYEKLGVRHQVTVRLLDMRPPIGQDIAIIDERHVFISPFGFASAKQKPVLAHVHENQPKIAKDYITWFNKLVDNSITYEEWLQEYGNKNNDTR